MKIFEIDLQNCVDFHDVAFVLDSGFLIHSVSWPNYSNCGEIVNNNGNYVISTYGYIVIFYGYPEYFNH